MEPEEAKRRSAWVTGVSNVANDLMTAGEPAAPGAFAWAEPHARDRIEAVRERLGDRRSFIQPGQDTRCCVVAPGASSRAVTP